MTGLHMCRRSGENRAQRAVDAEVRGVARSALEIAGKSLDKVQVGDDGDCALRRVPWNEDVSL